MALVAAAAAVTSAHSLPLTVEPKLDDGVRLIL